MTVAIVFGTAFIAFSIPFAVFFFMVRRSAKLVIIMTTSAFLWLVAALLTSVIWNILIPIKDSYWLVLIYGVFLQEFFRFVMWKLLKKAETGLNSLAPDGDIIITRELQAMVGGLGFGVMSCVMQFNIVLDAATGPGMEPSRLCGNMSLFLISAIITALFGLLHIFWSVVMHIGLEQRLVRGTFFSLQDWKIYCVLAAHLIASLLTINDSNYGPCAGTLVPLALLTVASGVAAWRCAGLELKVKGA